MHNRSVKPRRLPSQAEFHKQGLGRCSVCDNSYFCDAFVHDPELECRAPGVALPRLQYVIHRGCSSDELGEISVPG